MSRLLMDNPLVRAALAASLAFAFLAAPLGASGQPATSATVSVSATVNPTIRLVLPAEANPVRVITAVRYGITTSAAQDPMGLVGDGVCYTIVPQ